MKKRILGIVIVAIMLISVLSISAVAKGASTNVKPTITIENYFAGVNKNDVTVKSSVSIFEDGFTVYKKATSSSNNVSMPDGEALTDDAYSYSIQLTLKSAPAFSAEDIKVEGATVLNKGIVNDKVIIELLPPEAFVIESIELKGYVPTIGGEVVMPTIDSVNGKAEYKNFVSIDEDSSDWYFCALEDAEGFTDISAYPWDSYYESTFIEGNFYNSFVYFAAENGAVFATDSVVNLVDAEGNLITQNEYDTQWDVMLSDVYFLPFTYYANDGTDDCFVDYAVYGEDYIFNGTKLPFEREGFRIRGFVRSPNASAVDAHTSVYVPHVTESEVYYIFWNTVLEQVVFTLEGYEIGKDMDSIIISDGGVEFTPADGFVNGHDVWQIISGSFDPEAFFANPSDYEPPTILNGSFEKHTEYWLCIGSTDWEGIEQPYDYPWVAEGYTINVEFTERFFMLGGEGAALFFKLTPLHNHGTAFLSDENNHWNACDCGEKFNLAAHEDANSDDKCDICTYDMSALGTDGQGKDDGISTGAIVGIVAGAMVLLGGGGFAIFWFVIEKKSAADLLALVKSNTTVHSEATSKEETPKEENAEKQAEEANEE